MCYPLPSATISIRKSSNEHDRLILISHQLMTLLSIPEQKNLLLAIGKTTAIVDIDIIEIEGNEIVLPDHFFTFFRLPIQVCKLQIMYVPTTQTLKLGPIIALMTNIRLDETNAANFHSVHSFCEELHHVISESGGIFYVFSIDSFPKTGYFLHKQQWVPAELPIPDVIYNRIHSRRKEQRPEFQEFKKQLQLSAIPLFNDRFLSKWEVYDKLCHDSSLFSYIPETRLFSKETLFDFAQKYETVFIKPIHGSQGRNIIKLTRDNNGYYSFQTSFSTNLEGLQLPSPIEDIYLHLRPIVKNDIYLIQRGIDFIEKECKPLDFRILCHKQRQKQWKITSIVARIGGEQEFVSNLARGGTMIRPLIALRTCFQPHKARDVFLQIKELSVKIAEAVSFQIEGIFGELGIDIGVDLDGKPWLIEVNSKPSKAFENNDGKIRPSANAITQFCTILAFETHFEKEVFANDTLGHHDTNTKQ
ncbi:YheC/YheD family protein [Bacillus rubiinfantis]|uniref:YheC/YheD family endospore coat-associated protein n=1 Tax=Bacillus rubiinfantis TaxID=1499680 RepID=UPI0006947728|nr:YheC/YheD family protein [Bacillus rubiinfantis]